MAPRTKQRLDEVKLTLERLQRIALDPTGADVLPPSAETVVSKTGPAMEAARLTNAATAVSDQIGKRNIVLGVAAAIGVFAIAGTVAWMQPRYRPEPRQTAATAVDMPVRPIPVALPTPDGPQAISEAQTLLDTGQVMGARRMLIEITPPTAEAALMLARSYDPNFLKQFAQSDAAPDPAEAERWYRAWHTLAAKNGLMMEPDRLERIIKAMK